MAAPPPYGTWPAGEALWDESRLPVRHHLTWVEKGFRLVRIEP